MKDYEINKEVMEELSKEEVNVYEDCQKIKGCLLDCIDMSPWLSIFN